MANRPVKSDPKNNLTKEHLRLAEAYAGPVAPWRKWGPYVSERSWGSVREDYSESGNAWDYFTHDMARSKTYRWGEDGIAGICDRYQVLVFALALWNGRDPILKERMFGLSCNEGNHGEDCKEYWWYLDSTPTHSYMRMLYKYPQREFPYAQLVEESRRRCGASAAEYELLDTGIFEDDRYWDVFIEYAKADAEDVCIRIEAFNRGPETAELHLIPHLWFRNTWAWTDPRTSEPRIMLANVPMAYSAGGRFERAGAEKSAISLRVGGTVFVWAGRWACAIYRQREQQRAVVRVRGEPEGTCEGCVSPATS